MSNSDAARPDNDDADLIDYINCKNLRELQLTSSTPFSHGHSKGVFTATLKGRDVVVKKPIGDFLTVRLMFSVVFGNLRVRVCMYVLVFFCLFFFCSTIQRCHIVEK